MEVYSICFVNFLYLFPQFFGYFICNYFFFPIPDLRCKNKLTNCGQGTEILANLTDRLTAQFWQKRSMSTFSGCKIIILTLLKPFIDVWKGSNPFLIVFSADTTTQPWSKGLLYKTSQFIIYSVALLICSFCWGGTCCILNCKRMIEQRIIYTRSNISI